MRQLRDSLDIEIQDTRYTAQDAMSSPSHRQIQIHKSIHKHKREIQTFCSYFYDWINKAHWEGQVVTRTLVRFLHEGCPRRPVERLRELGKSDRMP